MTGGEGRTRRRLGGTGDLGRGAGVTLLSWQQCGKGAPQLPWSTPPTVSPLSVQLTYRGVSPAGYITHHCSAVSAVLYSVKHRMARPPGYATGAHVLAGCLPDRGCWSSLTHPHSPQCFQNMCLGMYIWLTLDVQQFQQRD